MTTYNPTERHHKIMKNSSRRLRDHHQEKFIEELAWLLQEALDAVREHDRPSQSWVLESTDLLHRLTE